MRRAMSQPISSILLSARMEAGQEKRSPAGMASGLPNHRNHSRRDRHNVSGERNPLLPAPFAALGGGRIYTPHVVFHHVP